MKLYVSLIVIKKQTFGSKLLPLRQNKYNLRKTPYPAICCIATAFVTFIILFYLKSAEGLLWAYSVFDHIQGCRQVRVSEFFKHDRPNLLT